MNEDLIAKSVNKYWIWRCFQGAASIQLILKRCDPWRRFLSWVFLYIFQLASNIIYFKIYVFWVKARIRSRGILSECCNSHVWNLLSLLKVTWSGWMLDQCGQRKSTFSLSLSPGLWLATTIFRSYWSFVFPRLTGNPTPSLCNPYPQLWLCSRKNVTLAHKKQRKKEMVFFRFLFMNITVFRGKFSLVWKTNCGVQINKIITIEKNTE